jgi:hypothetical protein
VESKRRNQVSSKIELTQYHSGDKLKTPSEKCVVDHERRIVKKTVPLKPHAYFPEKEPTNAKKKYRDEKCFKTFLGFV